MAKSRIIITFNSTPVYDNVLSIRNDLAPLWIYEVFRTHRDQNNVVTISSNMNTLALNYYNALMLDHNTTGLYNITRVNNVVTIEATQSNVVFNIQSNTGLGAYTIEIFNAIETPSITIDSVTFSQATTDQCNKVKLNVTTSRLAAIVNGAVNALNPFTYDFLRGVETTINVTDADGNTASKIVSLPGKLSAANTSINIINSPSGATVNISVLQTSGLTLEYSLDNVTFQSSNIYSGLAPGNFTVYIKDQLGCSISKQFTITSFDEVGTGIGIDIPYADLPSKSNSIRFKKLVTWGICGNYKNDENTLSCEADVQLPYKERQPFQTCDIITTQIRSNYANIEAKVIKQDLSEVAVPVVKKTSFIGLKDKRDAVMYNLGNGLTGIYFNSGNKYNFDTNVIEDVYALNGALPEWVSDGNYVVIDNVWYLIEDILFDETKLAEVIVISNVYTGVETNVIAGSIYNLFNYEDYEFVVDMAAYLDEKIQVRITETDPRFETVIFISEILEISARHENTMEIVYFNDDNTDINYSTLIQHKIRVPYLNTKGKADEDSEPHKTDTNVILLSAEIYEGEEFIFQPVTKEIWRKLMIALSHENVFINGVAYVKNGNFNTEGPLEDTNLYVLTANMIKTGAAYTTKMVGSTPIDGTETEIPGIISSETNYVSY